jgi:hypothetical protein
VRRANPDPTVSTMSATGMFQGATPPSSTNTRFVSVQWGSKTVSKNRACDYSDTMLLGTPSDAQHPSADRGPEGSCLSRCQWRRYGHRGRPVDCLGSVAAIDST